MVGYAYDYATDHYTGWHQHPRAQLLHAMSGTMQVVSATALFIVPPGTGLWVPAHTEHVTQMPGGLAMRGLFLRGRGAHRTGHGDGGCDLTAAAGADPGGVRAASDVGRGRTRESCCGVGASRDRPCCDTPDLGAGLQRCAAAGVIEARLSVAGDRRACRA